MDFYKKKLKLGKSSNDENLADVLNEVERKYLDMQPVIQDPINDGLKIQRTLSEIRAHVDYLHNFDGTVSEDQQQRIREITRKYKDVLRKYSNAAELSASGIKSPRLFRRRGTPEPGREPIQMPQNKIALGEVEEKLKSMRQKRLDRLSMFVAEQSKLSEERSSQNNDSTEMENAIRSIQKTEIETKVLLKSVVEENLTHKVITEEIEKGEYNVRNSPTLSRNRSNESTDKFKNKSSTRKFINKLNCTMQNDDSSSEDLTADNDDVDNFGVKYFKPEEIKSETFSQDKVDRHSAESKTQTIFKAQSLNKYKTEPSEKKNTTAENESTDYHHKLYENSSQHNKGTEKVRDVKTENEPDCYSPLLSPTGKQRKAVYLYEHECEFLENEKRVSLPSLTTFGKELHQETDTKAPLITHHSFDYKDKIVTTEFQGSLPSQFTDTQFGITFGKTHHKKFHDNTKFQLKDIIDKNESKQLPSVESVKLPTEKNDEEENVVKRLAVGLTGVTSRMYENVVKNDYQKSVTAKAAHAHKQDNKKSGPVETDRDFNVISKYRKSDPVETNQNISNKMKVKELVAKTETNVSRKSNGNLFEPLHASKSSLRSPVPLSRKNNHVERVLKKLQRNWESVNEILENDSDVDSDEIEDLKKTWEEADLLLNEYKMKIKMLEMKSHKKSDSHILRDIKGQLKDIEEGVTKFRGLRRDSTYKQLSSRLSNCFLEINKINYSSDEGINEKKTVLDEIERYIKILESRASRNEVILLEIFDAQVTSIGTNRLCITKV